PGGRDLAAHPARAEGRGAVPDLVAVELVEGTHLVHHLGVTGRPRIRRVKAGRVGEQHEQPRLEEDGHLRPEEVAPGRGGGWHPPPRGSRFPRRWSRRWRWCRFRSPRERRATRAAVAAS